MSAKTPCRKPLNMFTICHKFSCLCYLSWLCFCKPSIQFWQNKIITHIKTWWRGTKTYIKYSEHYNIHYLVYVFYTLLSVIPVHMLYHQLIEINEHYLKVLQTFHQKYEKILFLFLLKWASIYNNETIVLFYLYLKLFTNK